MTMPSPPSGRRPGHERSDQSDQAEPPSLGEHRAGDTGLPGAGLRRRDDHHGGHGCRDHGEIRLLHRSAQRRPGSLLGQDLRHLHGDVCRFPRIGGGRDGNHRTGGSPDCGGARGGGCLPGRPVQYRRTGAGCDGGADRCVHRFQRQGAPDLPASSAGDPRRDSHGSGVGRRGRSHQSPDRGP